MITTLTITGMRSVHCSRAVFTALAAVDGIVSAEIRMGHATVEHDGRATPAALTEAIRTAGYDVAAVREDRRRLV
jgi:copper chaperone CopZ